MSEVGAVADLPIQMIDWPTSGESRQFVSEKANNEKTIA
jgi:hypothetical protein